MHDTPTASADGRDELDPGRPYHPAYRPGAAPGALQFQHLDDAHYFGTQSPEAPPTGTTFQETMGTAVQWSGADEFTIQPGGLLAEHEAGPEPAGEWTPPPDVPALSAWDRVKAAVRHGWDRVRS